MVVMKMTRQHISLNDICADGDICEVNPSQLDSLINSGNKTVTLFYAPWCPHCKIAKPIFKRLCTEMEDTIMCMMDCEKHDPEKYKIAGFPTVVCHEDGMETSRNLGLGSKSAPTPDEKTK